MHIRMAEIMTGIVLAFTLITVGNWGYMRYDASIPAVEWDNVEVVTPVVKKGGELHLVYTSKVNKQCTADFIHFLIGPGDSEASPVRFPTVAGGYRKPTNGKYEKVSVTINIPLVADPPLANFPPGKYKYRSLATRYCDGGTQIDDKIPDAEFELVEK